MPLCFDLWPTWSAKGQRGGAVLLFGMAFLGLAQIVLEMDFFTQRNAYMQRLIEAGRQQGTHKLIIEEGRMPPYMHSPSFTFSVESMLFSALDPERRTVHLIRDTEWVLGNYAQTLQDSSLYLSTFRSFYDRVDSFYHHDQAPTQYYNFPPAAYQRARGRHPMPDSLALYKDQIQLTVDLAPTYAPGQQPLVLVTLHNRGTEWLGAAARYFSYPWWTSTGELLRWDHEWTALEIDVPPGGQYQQPMLLSMPTASGSYQLQLDLIGEGQRGWLHHPRRLPVQIE